MFKRETPLLDPTPAATATSAARARHHAENALALIKKTEGVKRGPLCDLHASKANAYATLAVYWQGEAEAGR